MEIAGKWILRMTDVGEHNDADMIDQTIETHEGASRARQYCPKALALDT